MTLRTLTALLVLPFFTALGETIRFPLPGQDWQITLEGPILNKFKIAQEKNGDVRALGNSGRFNVSLFVEPPQTSGTGTSNTACRDFYWSQGKKNPDIVADSVRFFTLPNCEVVEYRTQGKFEDIPYTQDHANCYFAHQGKWVDLHISIIQPEAAEEGQLKIIAQNLLYGPKQTSTGEAEVFPMGELGMLKLAVPAGWLKCNLLKHTDEQQQTGYSMSFQSAKDVNSNCQLTLFTAPKVPADKAALHAMVLNSTSSVASASVEKKAEIQELSLNHGFGATATFTDASLVGKPVSPGNAKTITTGFFVPRPKVLCVVSMFSDDAKGEDAAKMRKAVESIVLEPAP